MHHFSILFPNPMSLFYVLLGCTGLNNSVASQVYGLLCVLHFIMITAFHATRQEVHCPSVPGWNNNCAMFSAPNLLVSILHAAVGEQNDLPNDACEGPFRPRWISQERSLNGNN